MSGRNKRGSACGKKVSEECVDGVIILEGLTERLAEKEQGRAGRENGENDHEKKGIQSTINCGGCGNWIVRLQIRGCKPMKVKHPRSLEGGGTHKKK